MSSIKKETSGAIESARQFAGDIYNEAHHVGLTVLDKVAGGFSETLEETERLHRVAARNILPLGGISLRQVLREFDAENDT